MNNRPGMKLRPASFPDRRFRPSAHACGSAQKQGICYNPQSSKARNSGGMHGHPKPTLGPDLAGTDPSRLTGVVVQVPPSVLARLGAHHFRLSCSRKRGSWRPLQGAALNLQSLVRQSAAVVAQRVSADTRQFGFLSLAAARGRRSFRLLRC